MVTNDAAHLRAGTPTVLQLLRTTLHGAFFVLLAIAVVRRFTVYEVDARAWTAIAGALVLATVYAAGPLTHARWPSRRLTLVWLATVTAGWAVLLLLSPDFSWVAFPLFFLHLHLLSRVHAVVAVAVITGIVVATQAMHAQVFTTPMLLGPVLGAFFAVVIALGYAALHAESEQRRSLIEDLRHTREELAISQRSAGALAERERLAREIHDTLTQGLSSIVLLLRSAENALPGDHGNALGRIGEAQEAASDNLAEARRFVRGLTPPALAGDSLAGALRRLCDRVAADSGIDCGFHTDGVPVALPSNYEVTLLRAAQASLANVTAHARCRTAVVTLAFLETEVTLDIVDDGVGFDPGLASGPKADSTGFGIMALRERITTLGGRVDVESAPGEGAAVAVRLPLPAEETP